MDIPRSTTDAATDETDAAFPALPALVAAAPLGQPPVAVRDWFDAAAAAAIPDYDGTIGTARITADAFARLAKADNTRRAYRAGVRTWCAWCDQHALPYLPGQATDVVAFLAAERGSGLSITTVELRRAAIRYLHFIGSPPSPPWSSAPRPSTPAPSPASSRPAPPPPASSATPWAATASNAAP